MKILADKYETALKQQEEERHVNKIIIIIT
jgi:hypothetical protein